jgi:hypothetical protein
MLFIRYTNVCRWFAFPQCVCICNKRTSQPVICARTSAQLEYFFLFLVCLLLFNTSTNCGPSSSSSSSSYNLCLAQLWLFWDLRCSGCDHEVYRHLGYDAVRSGTGVVRFQSNQLHPLPRTITFSFIHTEVFSFPQLFRMPEIIVQLLPATSIPIR